MSERQCPADPHERPCFGGDHACCSTPDHPAEDAREARLSEGEVERLEWAFLKVATSTTNLPDWMKVPALGRDLKPLAEMTVEALAPVVADLIAAAEQRGAEEVKARVEAVAAYDDPGDVDYAAGYRDALDAVLRALGGTAGGREA